MAVIDAKYFREQLSEESVQQESILDEWLKEDVLPIAIREGGLKGQGFTRPEGFDNLSDRLERRGFEVSTYSGHLGDFIYLRLPPEKTE